MLTRMVALSGLLLLLSAPAAMAQGTATPAPPQKPESLCVNCHDQAKTFESNAHGRLQSCCPKQAIDVTCANCHGDGTKHAEALGDKALIKSLAGRAGSETCLTCHDRNDGRHAFRTGIHAPTEAVNCLSCHSIHSSYPKAPSLLAKKQVDLCAACHSVQAASFRNQPYGHRVGRGGIECASCHDPHGRPGKQGLKRTRADELPCLNCHAEKKGPYVYAHVNTTAGDCMSCHQPHGSNYPHMLKRARVDQLCLECHSTLNAGTLGSQPPAIHDTTLPRWRNCTTCHVAIHGSNRSPQLLK
jgi:DmsE family decaheme c-type cytochrome